MPATVSAAATPVAATTDPATVAPTAPAQTPPAAPTPAGPTTSPAAAAPQPPAGRPVRPGPAGRRLTRAGIAAFLDALAESGMVCEAAARAGVPRASLYRRRAADAAFAAAWAGALAAGLDRLRDEAVRRALYGDEQTVWHRGAAVGTVRRYSDQLLMFLLRAHQPALYREPRGDGERAARSEAAALRDAELQDALVADAYELGKEHGLQELLDLIDGGTRGIRDDPGRDGTARGADAADTDSAAGGDNGAGRGDAGMAPDDGRSAGAEGFATSLPCDPSWPPGYRPAAEPDGVGALAEPGRRPRDPP